MSAPAPRCKGPGCTGCAGALWHSPDCIELGVATARCTSPKTLPREARLPREAKLRQVDDVDGRVVSHLLAKLNFASPLSQLQRDNLNVRVATNDAPHWLSYAPACLTAISTTASTTTRGSAAPDSPYPADVV